MNRIIIVGGGHSGVEAANIITKMGGFVTLITKNIKNIGELSCNPSMGGIGKSNLVKEIDSLGGLVGYVSTKSAKQLKKINYSKGEAVSCTRIQLSRIKYKINFLKILLNNKKLKLIQDEVLKLLVKNNRIIGLKTKNNIYKCTHLLLSSGTFLNSFINIGLKKYKYGRIGEKSSLNLSKQLNQLLKSSRFKTGTPPRISRNGINFKNLKIQKSDENPIPSLSSWYNLKQLNNSENCWMIKTNLKTKNIVKKNLSHSPTYNNIVTGISPRYCPSFEDKIYKFNKKIKHNLFLEPDSNNLIYPSGLSTCLPYKLQTKLITSIKNLKNCSIVKPGYSVEYDFFCPKNLKKSLESKIIKGLFMAGQINGTTGYEEAASQGIVAGINMFLNSRNKKFWYPNKKNSYIGVLIGDIVKNGVTEPYRILTNRSNDNLNLRENNSNKRLLKLSKNLGVIYNKNFKNKNLKFFYNKTFKTNNFELIKKIKIQLITFKKYKNYIILKENYKKKLISNRTILMPKNINYFNIKGLSIELSEKLNYLKPSVLNKNIFKNLNNNFFNILFKYSKKLQK